MGLDLTTCKQNVFSAFPDLEGGIKAVCTHPNDHSKHAFVGYLASGDEVVVLLSGCSSSGCTEEAMIYSSPSSTVIA